MRETRDTFLRFLADNLQSIPLHNVRRDTQAPDAENLKINAINVEFLNADFSVHVSEQVASIDLIHEDELTALDWMQQLWAVLSAQLLTAKLDYTNPSVPVSTGGNIYWETPVRFRSVFSPFYKHFNCKLTLRHHIS